MRCLLMPREERREGAADVHGWKTFPPAQGPWAASPEAPLLF